MRAGCDERQVEDNPEFEGGVTKGSHLVWVADAWVMSIRLVCHDHGVGCHWAMGLVRAQSARPSSAAWIAGHRPVKTAGEVGGNLIISQIDMVGMDHPGPRQAL